MRVICLDVGERRIGVAVTDPLDITAQGVETIFTKGAQRDADRVAELCARYETDRVLLGLPRNMDGSEGFQAESVRAFGAVLAERGFAVRYEDERLTTKRAHQTLREGNVRGERRKGVVDMVAAGYILQSFLDSGGWREETEKLPCIRGVWHMSKDGIRDGELNQGAEQDMEPDNIVELVDEDGKEVRFEHLMTLEHKGANYICLAPLDDMEDVGEDELVILKIETDAEGNDAYVTVDDDEELDDVFEKYLEIAEADDGEDE